VANWSIPRTWVATEMANAALMNQYLRDNLTFQRDQVAAKITRVNADGVASIPNNAATRFVASTVEFDTGGMADVANNRINFILAGKYILGGCISFAAAGAGNRQLRIVYHDNNLVQDYEITRHSVEGFAALNSSVTGETIFDCHAGDYVYMNVYQDSGAALNMQSPAAVNDQRIAYLYALREGI
jgi:hypothetical protein